MGGWGLGTRLTFRIGTAGDRQNGAGTVNCITSLGMLIDEEYLCRFFLSYDVKRLQERDFVGLLYEACLLHNTCEESTNKYIL